MKKITYYISIVSLLLFVVTGCKKENTTDDFMANTFDKKSTVQDPNVFQRFAKSLAKTLEEQEVRVFIHEKANEQFDGDYDILFKDIAYHKFSDNENLIEKLVKNDNSTTDKNASRVFFESIIENEKRFNIAVPVNCDKWICQSFIPLVAIQGNDSQIEYESYDNNGGINYLDAKVTPTFPVVVVGINERTDNEGNLLSGFKFDNGGGIENPNDNPNPACNGCTFGGGGGNALGGGGGSGGKGGGGGSGGANPRADKCAEYLDQIKIPKMNDIELWGNGEPELWVVVTSATGIKIGEQLLPIKKREDADNKWLKIDRFIVTWDFTTFGNYIDYYFWEDDPCVGSPGDKIEYTHVYNGNTIKVTHTIQDCDEDCKNWLVGRYDKAGTTYSTGRVDFKMRYEN
jgi:hypothetical protein